MSFAVLVFVPRETSRECGHVFELFVAANDSDYYSITRYMSISKIGYHEPIHEDFKNALI